jgi:hypothetical protein
LDWAAQEQEILRLAGCQLFFVGGAPRSGTTWLRLLLDSHPEVCCRGEGLFQKHLADPLDSLVAKRREALAAKNAVVLRDPTLSLSSPSEWRKRVPGFPASTAADWRPGSRSP